MAKTEETLDVYVNFKAPRHDGLVIIWQIGTAKLHLMRMGGPQGTYKMQTKSHATYRTSEGAHAGAERWFKLLDSVFDTTNTRKAAETDV